MRIRSLTVCAMRANAIRKNAIEHIKALTGISIVKQLIDIDPDPTTRNHKLIHS